MTSHQTKLADALADFFTARIEQNEMPSVKSARTAIEKTDALACLLAPERGERARQIARAIAADVVERFVLTLPGERPESIQSLTDRFTAIILNEGGQL